MLERANLVNRPFFPYNVFLNNVVCVIFNAAQLNYAVELLMLTTNAKHFN